MDESVPQLVCCRMAKAIWKYVPDRVGAMTPAGFDMAARVTSVEIHPPVAASVHPNAPIRGDMTLVTIRTVNGRPRYHGFADACIGSRLKAVVKLAPGQERDEVIAKWKNAPASACGRKR